MAKVNSMQHCKQELWLINVFAQRVANCLGAKRPGGETRESSRG